LDPSKVLLIENSHPSLEAPGKGASPPLFLKMRPLWKKTSISRALLHVSFKVPSKGALPPISPYRAPTERERDALFQDPFFICLSESLVNEPPTIFSSGALMVRDAHF